MGDYIKRSEIKMAMKSVTDDTTCPLHLAAEIDQILELAPAADVRPEKHGTWKHVSDDDQDEGCYFCSKCNEKFFSAGDNDDILPKFCPNCGAKMDGKGV